MFLLVLRVKRRSLANWRYAHTGHRKIYILGVYNHIPMVSLTENEARVVSFLLRNFGEDYNINRVARELKLSPRGAYKILKKLEKEGFLRSNKVGNNLLYKINFSQEHASELCQFVLAERKISPYVTVWINDLQPLKEITDMAILFGSILTKENIDQIKQKKIHHLIQTKEDLVKNIRRRDPAVLEEIKTGLVLWGRDVLVEAIKNGQD